MHDTQDKEAFGAPGVEPSWSHGNKDGVGTAYGASSKLWFTLFGGIVTEVYFLTVDRPQMRDMQFIVTDGKSFFHEENRDLHSKVERLPNHVLGFSILNSDPQGRYSITKEVIADPHLPCLLQRVKLSAPNEAFLSSLNMFALCAPHLDVGGFGNEGYLLEINGHKILVACKSSVWLAMSASVPFSRTSCGYVGSSDGWTDLQNFEMDFEFDRARDGNML